MRCPASVGTFEAFEPVVLDLQVERSNARRTIIEERRRTRDENQVGAIVLIGKIRRKAQLTTQGNSDKH